MLRLIDSLGPKIKMIGLFQKINIMNNSRTEEELYIMVNSVHINTDRTCFKYAGYANFNGISREGKP